MKNGLLNYVGKFRVISEIDQRTNDFPRNKDDRIECDDVYIKCKKGKIYHFGGDIFVIYCDSLQKGRNILKKMGYEIGLSMDTFFHKTDKENVYKLKEYYSELEKHDLVFEIEETDSEVLWKFKEKDMDLMASYMNASTLGSSVSPFSKKNLPKREYIITDTDLNQYKKLIQSMPKDEMLLISQITRSFIANVMAKSKEFKGKEINKVMKKEMLKGKEFIHCKGFWKEYIKYLKKNINNKGEM